MRDLLGGKGANVAEMTRVLGPRRVPPGFTVTTEACVAFMRDGHEPAGLEHQVAEAMARLERTAGKRFADEEDPLLVSVRSGARESMPGMLDTILNVGLNDRSVSGLARSTENERFAWDSYQRLIEMFGTVVHHLPREQFTIRTDEALPIAEVRRLTTSFKAMFEFPQDPLEQLWAAV